MSERTAEQTRQVILDIISDAALCFAAYDRKECEELSIDDLERAIENGVIGFGDIAEHFARSVAKHMGYELEEPEEPPSGPPSNDRPVNAKR